VEVQQQLSCLDEDDAATVDALNILADELLTDAQVNETLQLRKRRSPAKHMLAKHLSRLAKGEFGRVKASEANGLVVRRWIRDQAREIHVRNTDVHSVTEWAMYYYWISDSDENDINKLTATRAYTESATATTKPRWWGNWLTGYGRGFCLSTS
jgi:hypothetical protein